MGENHIPNICLWNAHKILDEENLIDIGHFGSHFT